MATRIIAVLNQKGGVGKTTTSVNLGAALALEGRSVLLVDMDPQANLTVHLGLDPHRVKATSYSVLLGEHSLSEAMLETSVPDLRVVPSTLALANAEIQLASAVGRELILTEAIHNWLDPEPRGPLETALPFAGGSPVTAPPADFVLMDCPPSLGILTMNALCAATDVLLPIQTEFFALQGVTGILESIKAVKRLNKDLRLSMVLPSMVDFRTNLARDVVEEVRKYFGPLVTRTVIRTNIKLAEAPSYGQTIFEYDPNSRGAIDYGALAEEVLESSDPASRTPDEEAEPDAEPAAATPPEPAAVAEPVPVVREEPPPALPPAPTPPPLPVAEPATPGRKVGDGDFARALEVTGTDLPPVPVAARFEPSVPLGSEPESTRDPAPFAEPPPVEPRWEAERPAASSVRIGYPGSLEQASHGGRPEGRPGGTAPETRSERLPDAVASTTVSGALPDAPERGVTDDVTTDTTTP